MKREICSVMLVGFGLVPACCNEERGLPCWTGMVEAYVIGFDQCLANLETNEGKGFLLATDTGDTLMTYNLPDSVFSFPKDLFVNWTVSPFFPDTARSRHRIVVGYRPAMQHELVSAVCPGYVVFYPVTSTARQVVLMCIETD